MSKNVLFAVVLGTAISLPAQTNLVKSGADWYPACDEYGSSIDTTGGLFKKDGTVKVGLTLTPLESENRWPYIELDCDIGKPISGTDSITVEYSSDTPISMKLSQSDLGDAGDQSYAMYGVLLSASNEFTSRTFAITQFKQPRWAEPSSKAIKLNLDHVKMIYFVPEISIETGGKSVLTLKSLVLKSSK